MLVLVEVGRRSTSRFKLRDVRVGKATHRRVGWCRHRCCFGAGLENIGEILIAYGADQVLVNDNTIFADFHAEAWLPDLSKIISEVAPDIVLIGHSEPGTDLAPA